MTIFTLTPYRFTDDVPRMVAFLEAVGLHRSVTTESLGFAVMAAEHGGAVGVHQAGSANTGAPSGETQLVFSVYSAEDAARTLRRAGLDAITWDESYGRHAGVLDPTGGGIWINEEQDRYGYQSHPVPPGGGAAVSAVRYSSDMGADTAFFATFGLGVDGQADAWWTPLTGDAVGVLGLHKPSGNQSVRRETPSAPLPTVSLVSLGFETARDLAELATALTDAGFPAEVVTDAAATKVHVTDPDGCHVEIHSMSRS